MFILRSIPLKTVEPIAKPTSSYWILSLLTTNVYIHLRLYTLHTSFEPNQWIEWSFDTDPFIILSVTETKTTMWDELEIKVWIILCTLNYIE